MGKLCLSLVAVGCLISVACAQSTDKVQLTGTLETYFQAVPGTNGVTYTEDWAEERLRLTDEWRVILTQDYQPSTFTLDANFVEYSKNQFLVRAGRMRSTFGFAQWSDTNYNVEINDPMIRQFNVLPNLSLNRLDAGIEGQVNAGNDQVTVGVLDVFTDNTQILPRTLDHIQVRYQHEFDQLILGVDGLTKTSGFNDPEGTVAGLDFRYTVPHLILRGEYETSHSPSLSTNGYYVDATYRDPRLYRLELGLRNEGSGIQGTGQRSSVTTVGARYLLGDILAFNLNYGFGSTTSDLATLKGWSFQVCHYVHF